MTLKQLIWRLLNPRSRLDQVPGLASRERGEAPAGDSGGLRWRDVLFNVPLMLGVLIVGLLLALALYGPVWAPQNPYIASQHIVPHFDRETNEFIRPPLEPSAEHPLGTDEWGADILSMIMHGARNTLVAAAFITMVRVLFGLLIGAAAGWNEGRLVDRFSMGLIGTVAALPSLITSIILIYALDIRRGLAVFIVALSLIGWTEIAQYIRSEFLVLRKMPYIEGARATGLTGLQMAVRHVLPNLLPQLLVISFLEMGAVLMLLGELGFVGVYIGGGSRIDLSEPLGPTRIVTLADTPEWGAMIAGGYRWLRSKPFIVFPPAVAIFIAVAGFNFLGEGLRRLIEKHMVNTAFLLRKRMLLVIGGLTLAVVFIMNNTGAAPWFAKVARAFDGSQVYEHVVALTDMEGRGQGQPGGAAAADYIAARFEEYGLQPGVRGSSYVYSMPATLVRPDSQPELALLDTGGEPVAHFRHQIDFGYRLEGHGGSGQVTAPLTLVGFRPGQRPAWETYQGLDLQGRIVLLVEGNAPAEFPTEALIRGAEGVLWVTGDGPDDVRSQIQFASPDLEYMANPTLPIFAIRPAVAEQLLAQEGVSLTQMLAEGLAQPGSWFRRDLDVQVYMGLQLGQPQQTEIPNIVGYIPGTDLELGNEIVVLFVRYDGLGVDPDGTVYPGANEHAAGVAMLLELARLWQEQQLQARRTTLFVAWSGTALDNDGAREWLGNEFNFRQMRAPGTQGNVGPAILFQLEGIGAGEEALLFQTDDGQGLRSLVEETGQEAGLQLDFAPALLEETGRKLVSGKIPTWVTFRRAGPRVAPDEDRLERIETEPLQRFGEMLALTLTRLARETRY